jgi:hypothetical protein
VERELRRYLDRGILAHGFARARCGQCGHDVLIAFSCKERAVYRACNARRMVETATHVTDHVFPRLPARQWMLAVPKRLRYFLQHNAAAQGPASRVFLRMLEQRVRVLGSVPLLLKLGVRCKSLIRKLFPTERRPVNPQVLGSSPGRGAIIQWSIPVT